MRAMHSNSEEETVLTVHYKRRGIVNVNVDEKPIFWRCGRVESVNLRAPEDDGSVRAFFHMENSNSDGVVLPDITEAEQLASEHDENGDDGDEIDSKDHVSTVSVRHAGVPVSLPVG